MVALAALASGACESTGDVRHAVLLTTADFERLLMDPAAPETIVDGYGLPGGMRLDRIITKDASQSPELVKRDTYTNGYKSAYVTTEVWAGFDEVWVQPVYVAVSDYPNGQPPTRIPSKATGKWRPIFGVGPDSAFYSPFWQTIYFRIAPDDDPDTFQSVRDVFARGFDFRSAEGHLLAIAPDTVGVPPRQLMEKPGVEAVGGPTPGGVGVYDGQPTPFLDFGTETFTWDADRVVEEVPLYVWVVRDANGELKALDMPSVGGSGPPYSGRPPKVVGDKPKYGSYWRIYTVEMQPGWRVFAPPYFAEDRKRLQAMDYVYDTLPYSNALTMLTADAASSYDDFVGRVVTNPDCVKNEYAVDPTNLGDSHLAHADGTSPDPVCEYVDSQPKIEALVPANAIHRTDIAVTCPFIMYDYGAVVLP